MKNIVILLTLLMSTPVVALDLDIDDIKVSMETAIPKALNEASVRFLDLDGYILYSITPRILKGDKKGLHWQFQWQEKKFPHHKMLRVRVYVRDGSTYSERIEQSSF